jgi:hypothetical protein|tara:strand:+ start:1604 stop:2311 length:708 start_codon:yes stop_codon:yes gene_type:complete
MKKHVVVFDMDETLGYFQNMGIFYYTLQNYIQHQITFEIFCKLIDLYPQILRPKIFSILKYLIEVRRTTKLEIMIYTNNQGPKEWVQLIKNYFEYKLNTEIFTKIIRAFMVNGKVIEPKRTSHNKTYKDLLRTTRIPKEAKICMIDDVYYDGMENNNVYYLHIDPYVSSLHYTTMVDRLIDSKILGTLNKKHLLKNMTNAFAGVKFYEKSDKTREIDIIVGKTIQIGLQEFFQEM